MRVASTRSLRALENSGRPPERRLAYRDDRQPADRIGAALDQVGDEHVGHEVDRCGGVLQRIQQRLDARLRSHRQRQIDQVHPVGLDVLGDVLEAAQQAVPPLVPAPLRRAVIEITDQVDAGVAGAVQPVGQRAALLVHAHHHGAQRRSLQTDQVRGGQPQCPVSRQLRGRREPQPVQHDGRGKAVDQPGGETHRQQQSCGPAPGQQHAAQDAVRRQPQLRAAGRREGESDDRNDQPGRRQAAFDEPDQQPQRQHRYQRFQRCLQRQQQPAGPRHPKGGRDGGRRRRGNGPRPAWPRVAFEQRFGLRHARPSVSAWRRPGPGSTRPAC